MDPLQTLVVSLNGLLKVEVITALTGAPIALQWAKKLLPWFTGEWAAVITPLISATLILTQAWGLCSPACMVFQIIVGWIYIEVLYVRVVEPASKTTNPLIPDA